jgi:hypothetical protein
VEDKLGSIIFSHLFNGRLEIGKAMREGFYLAVEHANTFIPENQRIRKSLDALNYNRYLACNIQFNSSNSNIAMIDFLNKPSHISTRNTTH